ncbi:hypothetical protein M422DRAFT_25094 [Sphaerobolus stellatus SS14]|nr:hypothetical protein M422DRAFT_25094 [Sphaerobolus stellatus SS14]
MAIPCKLWQTIGRLSGCPFKRDSRLGIGNISVERLDIWRCTFPIVSRITWCWENDDCISGY